MPHLWQINYKFSVTREEFESGFDAVASQIAQVPGLRWKIWLLNEAESRGGASTCSTMKSPLAHTSKVPSWLR